MSQVDPVVTTTSIVVRGPGSDLATATLTDTRWPAMDELALTCPPVPLPAGRWLVTTQVSSIPGAACAPPICTQSDVTLANPGTIAVPSAAFDVYRQLDGTTSTVYVAVSVQRRDGANWRSYALGSAVLTIPAASASTPAKHYGSSVYVTDNPATSTFLPNGNAAGLRPFLDHLVAAGADMVRTSMGWSLLQPSSASFNAALATEFDTFMADCASRGLKVLAQLGGVPAWAGGSIEAATDAQFDAFFDAYFARWQPYAVEWDNEPNQGFGVHYGTPIPAADEYRPCARLFTRARAGSPSTLVGGVSLAYGDAAYLAQLYALGYKNVTDYISIHPYEVRANNIFVGPDASWKIGDPHQPWEHDDTGAAVGTNHGPGKWAQAVHAIYRTMRANGDAAKPIWVTEGGWSNSLLFPAPAVGLRCSETQQGDYLAYGLRQLARCPQVEVVLTYSTYDGQNTLTTWSGFGITRPDATRKPAWQSWKDAVAGIKAGTL